MTTTPAATSYTPTTWAQALLGLLGDPVTSTNVQAITAWEAAEGGNWDNPDQYNPLDTTQPETGAVSTNSAGVKSYTSWGQGLAATVTTLENGAYSSILSALSSGASASQVVSAVTASPWGTKSISLGAGETYTGGTSGSSSAGTTATDASLTGDLSDALGISSLATTVEHTAVLGLITLGGVALVVIGLLRGTGVASKAKSAAEDGAKVAAVAA